MNRKVFLFYQSEIAENASTTIDYWIKFFQLKTSGEWKAEEINTVPFSSLADVERVWNNSQSLDYAIVVVVGEKKQFHEKESRLGEKIIAVDCKFSHIDEYVFYPNKKAKKSIVIFDTPVSDRYLDNICIQFSKLQLINSQLEHSELYANMIKKGDYGCIMVKPIVFHSADNLLVQMLLLYSNHKLETSTLLSIDDVIKKINISASIETEFVCRSGRRLYSFPMLYV